MNITIQGVTVDRQNAEGITDSALWQLHGDSHQLFLYDGSSKGYAGQARLCSDLASLQLDMQSSCLGWAIVTIVWYYPMTRYFLQL